VASRGGRDAFREHRERRAAEGWGLARRIRDIEIGDGAPTVEFVRVEYDLDAAMRGIRASELPDEFANLLRTGGRLSNAASTS
jgi:hypothetical protein